MTALTLAHLLQPKQSFVWIVLLLGSGWSFCLVAGPLLHHELCVRPLWLTRAPSVSVLESDEYTPTSIS